MGTVYVRVLVAWVLKQFLKLQLICTFQIMIICKDFFFAYQSLDNVTMCKYAKFDQNIQSGYRVMSIFTKSPRQPK